MTEVATTVLTGPGGEVRIGDGYPFRIIGERINPTGRKQLTEELKVMDMTTVKADAATSMFATMRLIREELGVNVSCGASNISFGMPDRRGIDATFLAMSIMGGMNTAITNPLHEQGRKAILAADLLLGADEYGAAWIAEHRRKLAAAQAGV